MTKKCANCENKFQSERENQVYCSDACKTQAHRKKQKENRVREAESDNKRKKFSLNKYKAIVKAMDSGLFSSIDFCIQKYCFITFNLSDSISVEDTLYYINHFVSNENDDLMHEEFKTFVKNFHSLVNVVE
jgi:hypothetical protein